MSKCLWCGLEKPKKTKWKIVPEPDRKGWVTIQDEEGFGMGFRYFPMWAARVICFVENHWPDSWVADKVSLWYMRWNNRSWQEKIITLLKLKISGIIRSLRRVRAKVRME